MALAFREASLLGALLSIDGVEQLGLTERVLGDLRAEHDGPVVIEGEHDWTPPARHALGVVPVPRCDLATRRTLWERELAAHGVTAAPDDVRDVAARFHLGPDRIADAPLTAVGEAGRRAARAGWDARAAGSPPSCT
ncbi:hypothetical protein [Streptomyces bobili]|uniref:hypothetical protein n=1 Tax=Streptomyces bobili TaxID=67280 RepID=UPI0037B4F577